MKAVVKTDEWARFKRDLSKFAPTLSRALQRQVRKVGREAVKEVRSTVTQPPPTGGGSGVGSREAIARATRLTVSKAGVRVSTGNVRNGFTKAYNSGSFRHPVYGTNTWVEQQGRPYFGSAIQKTMRTNLVAQALDAAVRAIGAKGK